MAPWFITQCYEKLKPICTNKETQTNAKTCLFWHFLQINQGRFEIIGFTAQGTLMHCLLCRLMIDRNGFSNWRNFGFLTDSVANFDNSSIQETIGFLYFEAFLSNHFD